MYLSSKCTFLILSLYTEVFSLDLFVKSFRLKVLKGERSHKAHKVKSTFSSEQPLVQYSCHGGPPVQATCYYSVICLLVCFFFLVCWFFVCVCILFVCLFVCVFVGILVWGFFWVVWFFFPKFTKSREEFLSVFLGGWELWPSQVKMLLEGLDNCIKTQI